jgi:hypothetical protein
LRIQAAALLQMFGRLFHRNEAAVEPSQGSASSQQQQQHDEWPHAAAAAPSPAAPSFLGAHKTPRALMVNSPAASRQASQQLPPEDEEDEEEEEEAGDSEPHAAAAAVPAAARPRPALLQVKTAAEYSEDMQPVQVAVSAPSAASMRSKSVTKQLPARSTPAAAAKPWKMNKQGMQQQQPQQELQHQQQPQHELQQQQQPQHEQQQQAQHLQQQPPSRGFGGRPGGVEELQKQLMLEAKAREVSDVFKDACKQTALAALAPTSHALHKS